MARWRLGLAGQGVRSRAAGRLHGRHPRCRQVEAARSDARAARYQAGVDGGAFMRAGPGPLFRAWRRGSSAMNIAAKKNTWEEDMAKNIKFSPDVKVRTKEYKIGCIGAGMIMAECHLAAYKEAGFPVVAIASRTKANAEKVAKRWGIPVVHATPEVLIEDEKVEIVDLAFPPDQQPALIRHALKQKHIKAILVQKPLALSLKEAIEL